MINRHAQSVDLKTPLLNQEIAGGYQHRRQNGDDWLYPDQAATV
jgi:hypothetical protein